MLHELRKLAYVPKTILLGSREKLCVNPEVMEETNEKKKRKKCRDLGMSCKFRKDEDAEPCMPHEAFDIEEFRQLGDHFRMCPYY